MTYAIGRAPRARAALRHGEPRRGPRGRPRADPGRVHAGGGRARSGSLLDRRARAATMRRDLAEVRARLGGRGASRRAAAAVLEVARRGGRVEAGTER